MFRLVYFSTAKLDLKPQDLTDILDTATRINAERSITGVLLYNGLNFLQLLEGSRTDVETVFSRIMIDRRHSNIVTVLTEPASARLFPDWSMMLKRLPAIADGPSMKAGELGDVLEHTLPEHLERIFLNFSRLKG